MCTMSKKKSTSATCVIHKSKYVPFVLKLFTPVLCKGLVNEERVKEKKSSVPCWYSDDLFAYHTCAPVSKLLIDE